MSYQMSVNRGRITDYTAQEYRPTLHNSCAVVIAMAIAMAMTTAQLLSTLIITHRPHSASVAVAESIAQLLRMRCIRSTVGVALSAYKLRPRRSTAIHAFKGI